MEVETREFTTKCSVDAADATSTTNDAAANATNTANNATDTAEEVTNAYRLDEPAVAETGGPLAAAVLPSVMLVGLCDSACEMMSEEDADAILNAIITLNDNCADFGYMLNALDGELTRLLQKYKCCYAGVRTLRQRCIELRTFVSLVCRINNVLREAKLDDFLAICNNVLWLPKALHGVELELGDDGAGLFPSTKCL